MDLILAVIVVICIIIIVWLHSSAMPSTFFSHTPYQNETVRRSLTQLEILHKLESDGWKLIINPEERDSQDQILLLYPHAHIEYYFIKSNPLLVSDYDIDSPIWVAPSGARHVGYMTLLDIENLLYS